MVMVVVMVMLPGRHVFQLAGRVVLTVAATGRRRRLLVRSSGLVDHRHASHAVQVTGAGATAATAAAATAAHRQVRGGHHPRFPITFNRRAPNTARVNR